MSQSYFSSLAALRCHKEGTDNLDLATIAIEFVSKRDATLPCWADEISQNLRKEVFFRLKPYK